MADTRAILADLTEALSDDVELINALTAAGMLATGLVMQVEDRNKRAELADHFCTVFRESLSGDLN